ESWDTSSGAKVDKLDDYTYRITNTTNGRWGNVNSDSIFLRDGESATVSFEILEMKGDVRAQLRNLETNGRLDSYMYLTEGRNVKTFKNDTGEDIEVSFWFTPYGDYASNDGTQEITVKKVKLEKGNKATDWSPAPEDLVGSEDYTGEKLVSMIEQTANSITLSANKINFDGHVFGRDATFAGNVEARNIVVNEGDIRVFTSGTNEEYTLVPHTNMVSDAGFEGLPLHDIPHNTSHLDKEPLFYHTDRTGYLGGDLSWGEEGKPSIHKGDTYSDSVAIFGSRSAVVNNTNYFFQRPTFKGGTRYTLSAYFSSSGHRNGDGYPMMTLYVKQGEVSSTAPTIERRDYKSTRKVTNKPVRHTFTFTTPNLKINKKDYYAGIDIKSTDSKYVMADGIQL